SAVQHECIHSVLFFVLIFESMGIKTKHFFFTSISRRNCGSDDYIRILIPVFLVYNPGIIFHTINDDRHKTIF
ncbi:MAG: hypothetical protein OEZ34_08795, partial [Spirochaetia bacterium]|nr:hypothetical protein [Spirochaetia bacterium]